MTDLTEQARAVAGHTRGPWRDGNEAIHMDMDRANPWAGTVFRVSEMSDARALVAMVFGPSVDECIATARTISATPELLYAATLLTELGELLGENNAAVMIARDAVAKATGLAVRAELERGR